MNENNELKILAIIPITYFFMSIPHMNRIFLFLSFPCGSVNPFIRRNGISYKLIKICLFLVSQAIKCEIYFFSNQEEVWRDNQIIEMSTDPEFLSILSLTKEISMNSIDDFGS